MRKIIFIALFIIVNLVAYGQNFTTFQIIKISESSTELIKQYTNYAVLLGDQTVPNDEKIYYKTSFFDLFSDKQVYVYNDLDPTGKTSEMLKVSEYADYMPLWYTASGVKTEIDDRKIGLGDIKQQNGNQYYVNVYAQKTISGLYLSKTMNSQTLNLEFRIAFEMAGSSVVNFKIVGINKKGITPHNNNVTNEDKDLHAWQAAKNSNTIASYKNYVNNYPNGKYASQAQAKITQLTKEENDKLEERVWQNAVSQNTKLAYENYLQQYQSGKYVQQANQKINEFNNTKIITGIVTDEKGTPIYNVSIFDGRNNTKTEFDGKFKIEISSSTNYIICNHDKYKSKTVYNLSQNMHVELKQKSYFEDSYLYPYLAGGLRLPLLKNVDKSSPELNIISCLNFEVYFSLLETERFSYRILNPHLGLGIGADLIRIKDNANYYGNISRFNAELQLGNSFPLYLGRFNEMYAIASYGINFHGSNFVTPDNNYISGSYTNHITNSIKVGLLVYIDNWECYLLPYFIGVFNEPFKKAYEYNGDFPFKGIEKIQYLGISIFIET